LCFGIALTVVAVVLTIWSGADYFWKARHVLRDLPTTDSAA
jgi:hypothetical protein